MNSASESEIPSALPKPRTAIRKMTCDKLRSQCPHTLFLREGPSTLFWSWVTLFELLSDYCPFLNMKVNWVLRISGFVWL